MRMQHCGLPLKRWDPSRILALRLLNFRIQTPWLHLAMTSTSHEGRRRPPKGLSLAAFSPGETFEVNTPSERLLALDLHSACSSPGRNLHKAGSCILRSGPGVASVCLPA